MMNCIKTKATVVLGTCWLNESEEVLNGFLRNIRDRAKELGINAKLVVFLADNTIDSATTLRIKAEIANCTFIYHKSRIFPNKNFGVAAIAKYASDIGAEITAVIDSDYGDNIEMGMLLNAISMIVQNEADFIITENINASGRSNKLIGRVALNCFYNNYDFITTPFSGGFFSKTNDLLKIVTSFNYRFDWGGEWNLLYGVMINELRIKTIPVSVNKYVHRQSQSKIYDAFQIWRAIIENVSEASYQKFMNCDYIINDGRLKKYLSPIRKGISIQKLANEYKKTEIDKTEEQMLLMVIYPLLALINEEYSKIPYMWQEKEPYDTEILNSISSLAPACIWYLFHINRINWLTLHNKASNVTGGYWGEWNKEQQRRALEKVFY